LKDESFEKLKNYLFFGVKSYAIHITDFPIHEIFINGKVRGVCAQTNEVGMVVNIAKIGHDFFSTVVFTIMGQLSD